MTYNGWYAIKPNQTKPNQTECKPDVLPYKTDIISHSKHHEGDGQIYTSINDLYMREEIFAPR